ncbi:hypothetical protein ACYCII_16645 [Enterobacter roggenkampii]|uniref:hypothetical protein n=1 Tax=Enterobacter roggenkampii TaxID=1812935 RepID=UPI003D6E9C11
MSNKYEDLIKNARMNADCGEHMSPAEVTTLLNVVETTFAALAGEVYDLKHPGTYLPSKRETPATDAFMAEVRAQGVDSAINTVIAMMNHQHPVTSKAIDILRVHAYQIRKGAAQ